MLRRDVFALRYERLVLVARNATETELSAEIPCPEFAATSKPHRHRFAGSSICG